MENLFTFKMPDIGEGVVEGEVIEWLKNVGDFVQKDEPVVVVMTDKATVELPTPHAGKLLKQYYKAGEMAIKDKPLYDIALESSEVVEKKAEAPKQKTEVSQPKPSITHSEKTLAAPPVRKIAKELNIDLELVKGTGPEGLVTKEDLSAYSQTAKSKPPKTALAKLPGDEEKPIQGIKNLMAEKMAESKAIIPHFSYFDEADATHLGVLREKLKDEALEKQINLTFMPFFIKALSLTLRKHPLANSSVDMSRNALIQHKSHNIGIAMATPLGLIVPVLKNVHEMGLFDIVYAYEELKEKAKNQKLLPSDMKEATITITNFGALSESALFATPIINYPETAILGLSRIQKRPIVIQDAITIRSMLNCSWSFDHRVIDGDEASKISSEFVNLIQNPASLI